MRRLMHSSAIDRFDEERDVEGLSRTFAAQVATYVCLCPEVCVSLSTIECRNEFQTESIKHRNDVTRVTQSLSARISGIARSRHYLGTLAITLVCRTRRATSKIFQRNADTSTSSCAGVSRARNGALVAF
jgi:hypothetical protein